MSVPAVACRCAGTFALKPAARGVPQESEDEDFDGAGGGADSSSSEDSDDDSDDSGEEDGPKPKRRPTPNSASPKSRQPKLKYGKRPPAERRRSPAHALTKKARLWQAPKSP